MNADLLCGRSDACILQKPSETAHALRTLTGRPGKTATVVRDA